ncbi:MAG: dienelactone hydrolase family protein [Candidatus Limnocylindrales bacterium]
MAFLEYLATEVAEDWTDGLISRREALRRLAMLGLSASAGAAILAACASPAAPASGPGSTPRAASSPASSQSPASASAASGSGASITFAGPRGELQGYLASAASEPAGAMLVIHENRGLTDHIRSVADRLAVEGYTSLAVDLVSEEGGTAALGDSANVTAALSRAPAERLVADMRAGLDELARRAPGAPLGVIGFCFGGAMVWTLLDATEPRLVAAVPFYGPAPDAPSFDGNEAAVLAVYAELDDRVNASRDRATAALEAAGLPHEVKTYPGVDHAFFNDTGGRYDPTQAAAAYADVLAWLREAFGG